MTKVLIIGASRGIGLETVKTALLAGHSVSALARSAASIPVENPALEKVPGDALDSSTIRSALKGVDVVVQTLGVDIAPRSIFERTTLNDKDVQEWIIGSSELDWTIVRPGLLTNRPATGRYRILTAAEDWTFGLISRADVADFIVRQIDDRKLIRTTPLIID